MEYSCKHYVVIHTKLNNHDTYIRTAVLNYFYTSPSPFLFSLCLTILYQLLVCSYYCMYMYLSLSLLISCSNSFLLFKFTLYQLSLSISHSSSLSLLSLPPLSLNVILLKKNMFMVMVSVGVCPNGLVLFVLIALHLLLLASAIKQLLTAKPPLQALYSHMNLCCGHCSVWSYLLCCLL